MKKTLLLLTAALAMQTAHADEGMWTLYNLPPAVYEQMQAEGFQMSYNDLYYGDKAIKNVVVNFSGYCTGVVVSPDGLVFTNHHCGFEAIRSHSTVEHDYMLNGFVAQSYAEELPNEDMFVSFMIDQNDITERLMKMGYADMEAMEKELLVDSLTNLMTDSVKRIDPTYHVTIDPFYEGNKFYATVYQDFTDLRLVFTIPKSMGKFGGDTDNWMWPRQTCDFSVFRIYCDPKTGGPAAYSADNVPYHPKAWAPVSLQGYKDGDFAMTIGYPGSTSRYMSSYGIQARRDGENSVRAEARGVKQEIMRKHMEASEAVRIKYDSKYAQSSNYWKNSIGMNKCIDSIGIVSQKQRYEQEIRNWQDSTGYLKGKLDFDVMRMAYDKRFNGYRAFYYLWETLVSTTEFASRARKLNGGIEVKGPKDKPNKQYVEFPDNSNEWDEALEKEVMTAMLREYENHVDGKYLPNFYKTIYSKFGGNYSAYVDYLYSKSMLMKGKKIYINKKDYNKDPGVEFGNDLFEIIYNIRDEISEPGAIIEEQERLLCAAVLQMEMDRPHSSDANFTMRLSYGQVGGYTLNGSPSGYYTTPESIVKKMKTGDENSDYYAEPIMHELLSASDYGKYSDSVSKTMNLCFLTNNDITGGNSGSPMFDGKGQLIGLAFDGNWDSLSSDIHFDTELARCIGVDIRFVMFMMDKWGHADRLIREIDAK